MALSSCYQLIKLAVSGRAGTQTGSRACRHHEPFDSTVLMLPSSGSLRGQGPLQVFSRGHQQAEHDFLAVQMAQTSMCCRADTCPDLNCLQTSLLSVLTDPDATLHMWLMLPAVEL